MNYGSDYKFIPATSIESGHGIEVLRDLFCYTIQIVNICFVGNPKTNDFVLVDAGMPKCANEIISIAKDRFGTNSRPKAIILTHGHFDHVGGIIELIKYQTLLRNVKVHCEDFHLIYPFLNSYLSKIS